MNAKTKWLTGEVFSAFVLRDDGTWQQPSFRISRKATEAEIERALLRQYDGFIVYGLGDDSGAPEEYIDWLKIDPPKRRKK